MPARVRSRGRCRGRPRLIAAVLAGAVRCAHDSPGGAPQACQAAGRDGGRCPDRAEVKLADSLGDSVWACLLHAEEILVTVPAAFIASHDDRGIAVFLAGH